MWVVVSAAAAVLIAATSVPAGVAARGRLFTSMRYRYTIALPPGWSVNPATENLNAAFADIDAPQSDKFNDLGNPLFPTIGVAAEKLRAKATPRQWARRVAGALTVFGCNSHAQASRRFAGEASWVLIYPSCPQYLIVITTVHHGRGYDVYWTSPASDRRTRTQSAAAFGSFLRTFRFTD